MSCMRGMLFIYFPSATPSALYRAEAPVIMSMSSLVMTA